MQGVKSDLNTFSPPPTQQTTNQISTPKNLQLGKKYAYKVLTLFHPAAKIVEHHVYVTL